MPSSNETLNPKPLYPKPQTLIPKTGSFPEKPEALGRSDLGDWKSALCRVWASKWTVPWPKFVGFEGVRLHFYGNSRVTNLYSYSSNPN